MYNSMTRKSPKYKKIENYTSWEFTNNIAYELTIRTEEYRSIKERLEALINIMKTDYKSISNKKDIKINIHREELSGDSVCFSYEVPLNKEYQLYLNIATKRMNHMSSILLKGYKQLGLNMLHELSNELNEFIYNAKVVKGDSIKTLIADRKIFIDPTTQQFNEASDSLYLSFERPKISFPSTPKAHIEINTHMKEKELIEYVTEVIKRTYKEEPNLVQESDIFPELFDTEEHKHHKENYKGKRFADLFFIYDYVKCKQKESKTYHAIILLEDEIQNLQLKIANKNIADSIDEYSHSYKDLEDEINRKKKELENYNADYAVRKILEEKYLQQQLNNQKVSYLEKEYKRINGLIRNYPKKKLI